jgi:protoporphyrinogen oxidase
LRAGTITATSRIENPSRTAPAARVNGRHHALSSRRSMDKHVIVLGAGPAGLTAAYELCRLGIGATVLEADGVVGGLARTQRYKGYLYDIGGHRFFTKMGEVQRIWDEILGDDLIEVPRLSRILYGGRFFYYPLRPLNALFGLGLSTSLRVTASYAYARLFPSLEDSCFEDYVVNRFGRRLYDIFFKTYTEKVWGISCREIRAEWAAQRIKNLSFTSAVSSALFGPRKGIRTLIDRFRYPRLGPGMMWERMRERVEARGVKVFLDAPVVRIERDHRGVRNVTVRRNGAEVTLHGTDVISTLPLKPLISLLAPAAPADVRRAADSLRYRDFLTVVLILDKAEVFPDNWIYVHTPEVHVGRIQNFKNWSPAMVPNPAHTSLGLEYFVSEGDSIWSRTDAELVALATRELEALGLAKASDVIDGTVKRMRHAYPIYDSQYQESLEVVREYVDTIGNLVTVGRNGLHKYNNQDHSMMTALLAARNLSGERHDVWTVNAEEEYLEEVRLPRAV